MANSESQQQKDIRVLKLLKLASELPEPLLALDDELIAKSPFLVRLMLGLMNGVISTAALVVTGESEEETLVRIVGIFKQVHEMNKMMKENK